MTEIECRQGERWSLYVFVNYRVSVSENQAFFGHHFHLNFETMCLPAAPFYPWICGMSAAVFIVILFRSESLFSREVPKEEMWQESYVS